MNAAARAGRKAIRAASEIVNLAVLTVILAAMAFGGYALWDSYYITESATAEQYAKYKPTADGGPNFAELYALNPDVCGWLTVYGTNIDYPVTQAEDNWKYINTSADCKYSLTGSIFLDHRNSRDFTDFNSIIYGHNMTPKVMFGNIKDFKAQSFFDSHKYGDIFYGGRHYGLELFEFLSTDAYDSQTYAPGVTGDSAKKAYLGKIERSATFIRDIGVTTADRIVLLSTCSNTATNERDILVGRIGDNTYPDPFETAEEKRAVSGVDGRDPGTIWESLPIWAWGVAAALIILAVVAIIRRRKH